MDILLALLELTNRSLQVMSNTFMNNIANFQDSFVFWLPEETEEKENQTKQRLSVKPFSHVRILRYLMWAIENLLDYEQDL